MSSQPVAMMTAFEKKKTQLTDLSHKCSMNHEFHSQNVASFIWRSVGTKPKIFSRILMCIKIGLYLPSQNHVSKNDINTHKTQGRKK